MKTIPILITILKSISMTCITRKLLLLTIILLFTLFTNGQPSQLFVSEDQTFLSTAKGDPVFLNGDTGWRMVSELTREEAVFYLDTRAEQGFNCIGLAAIMGEPVSAYGDEAFEKSGDTWEVDKPKSTKGKNFSNVTEYDYWDHLEYIIDEAGKRDMYIALVINFTSWVVGDGNGEDRENILFDENKAYAYGNWMGKRFGSKPHLLWMMGGDRSAIYGQYDYRHVFDAMAEGVADGKNNISKRDGKADYSDILISYHPQKANPSSSLYVHDRDWMAFNSIQACPYEIEKYVSYDLSLDPPKPTWLFEGRYEQYTFDYDDWHMRFQAYLSVFAGGFGHLYGQRDVWAYRLNWKQNLQDAGALDMQHLRSLMSTHLLPYDFSKLRPSKTILTNDDMGFVEELCWKNATPNAPYATRLAAMSSEDNKCIVAYASDGGELKVNVNFLPAGDYQAFWYNPREGTWIVDEVQYLEKQPYKTITHEIDERGSWSFDPPGEPSYGNDWVLVLEYQNN